MAIKARLMVGPDGQPAGQKVDHQTPETDTAQQILEASKRVAQNDPVGPKSIGDSPDGVVSPTTENSVPFARDVLARPPAYVPEPTEEELQAEVNKLVEDQERELAGPRREFFSVTHYQVLGSGIRIVEHSVYDTDPRLGSLSEPPKFIPAGATDEQLKNLAAARWYPADARRPVGYDPLRFRYAVVTNPDGSRSLVQYGAVNPRPGKPGRTLIIVEDTRDLPDDAKFRNGQEINAFELRRALQCVPQSIYYAIRGQAERELPYCTVKGVRFIVKPEEKSC